ncbi:hypothetical protein Efla_001172 [Eimeria flavescens]
MLSERRPSRQLPCGVPRSSVVQQAEAAPLLLARTAHLSWAGCGVRAGRGLLQQQQQQQTEQVQQLGFALLMPGSGSGGRSPTASLEERRRAELPRGLGAFDASVALGGTLRAHQKGAVQGGRVGTQGGPSPAKRLRAYEDDAEASAGGAAGSLSAAGAQEGERWRLLEQLSQVIPTAGSLLPGGGGGEEEGCLVGGAPREARRPAAIDALDWEACTRALDRLVGTASEKEDRCLVGPLDASPASSREAVGLFDLPVGPRGGGGMGALKGFLEEAPGDPLETLAGGAPLDAAPAALVPVKRDGSSNAADPMKERQRRELLQKRTLDLAAQIISRFRGARRPGVLQLLHRFFSCSSRQVRDPQELEKLVGACCYIIARQQGDDMSLNDVTAQLERRQGSKGRQRCRCISKWVVKVCGKLQLRCLPRHRDPEAMASNALRRICSHLKLLLTQQEQQELLLLQQLKDAYRQCLREEEGLPSGGEARGQEAAGDAGLAELDDEELLRLLLIQQQGESAAAVAAAAARDEAADAPEEEGDSGAERVERLPDVEAFLQQFDSECSAQKSQAEAHAKWQQPGDAAAAAPAAADDPVVSLAADGSLQLSRVATPAADRHGERRVVGSLLESEALGPPDLGTLPLGGDTSDPALLDAQIQQHECVLRLLRLLPSAQRIKLDHSMWMQKQRKLALQQLSEQSSLVIKCVGLLQQLTALAFACAAAKGGLAPPAGQGGGGPGGPRRTATVGGSSSRESETTQADTPHLKARQALPAEAEDPLDEGWVSGFGLLLLPLLLLLLLLQQVSASAAVIRAAASRRGEALQQQGPKERVRVNAVEEKAGLEPADGATPFRRPHIFGLESPLALLLAAAASGAEVPVFQRVVLEALKVDRRSVYKRRREQLYLTLNIFRKLPGAGEVHLKNLGPLLIKAVGDPKMRGELLHIAETEPLPALASDGFEGADEKHSSSSGGSSSMTSGPLFTSQTASGSSREELSAREVDSTRGSSPVGGAPSGYRPRPPSLCGGGGPGSLAGEACCDSSSEPLSSAAAAAAALKELEDLDPVLAETPMARVVSLQYERTQQRWVCKWREGVGSGGRWHRRCFSVVKYGEDGAHTLAAAVAKKLRDRRSQEAAGGGGAGSSGGSRQGGGLEKVTEGHGASGKGGASGLHSQVGRSKRGTAAGWARPSAGGLTGEQLDEFAGHRAAAANAAFSTKAPRTGRRIAAAAGLPQEAAAAAGALIEGGVGEGRRQRGPEGLLLPGLAGDPALTSVVASAAYSNEMERLAQLLHKARSNPLLAKWLDERAPPPGAAALRAAAESLVPFLALQNAAADKAPPSAAAASFGPQQQPLQRRGRVAGAREGM